MTISDIITLELLSYYDRKLKDFINHNYSTKNEIETILTNIKFATQEQIELLFN